MTEVIRLSFTIKRLQRVLNPPERLFFALLGLAGILLCGLVLIGVGVELLSAPNSAELAGVAVSAASGLFIWLIFRKPMTSFFNSLFGNDYINTVVIEDNSVNFGVDKPQATFSRKSLRVGRGLCGVSIVRHPFGSSITIPQHAISLAELRDSIEREKAKEDAGQSVPNSTQPKK